jgi:mannose-6-phosphate isomerase-like protein (cupin superfamily)
MKFIHQSQELFLSISSSSKMFPSHDRELQRSLVFHEGDKLTIPKKMWHHVGNIGDEDAKIIEVWIGNILDEKDIERKSS